MLTYNELQQLNIDAESILNELAPLSNRIKELELEAGTTGFWNDIDYATRKTKELGEVKARQDKLLAIEDAFTMRELIAEELQGINADNNNDWENATYELYHLVQDWKKEQLFRGKYDDMDAIITVHAGSGGTESCDFTEIVFRMIARWADTRGFAIKLTDQQPGDVAGIKSATMVFSGTHAYGYTKALNGIFRLVRISPFDAANRRHTSFMAVEVVPRIEHDDTIEINDEDIILETMRAHVHAGGQNVNKVNSAVRITHIPTGIVVRYDAERSQLQNRNAAMELLTSQLAELKRKEHEAELYAINGDKSENGWGNAAISITLMPYQLVKDNRTGWESSNTSNFLDGDLDSFINKYLEWTQSKEQIND